MAKKIKTKRSAPEPEHAAEDVPMEPAVHSQDLAQRPKTSPYTSSPATLRVGSKTYYVLEDLLQNPNWIASYSSWSAEIHLPDIDEDTGHVLAHYLYTGTYQTLNNVESSPGEEIHIEFKRAVLTYAMAKAYDLHGLVQLSKEKIQDFGVHMNIIDMIEAINKDFAKLPSHATWLRDYLYEKASTAFEDDHTLFLRHDLFSRIEDIALMRLLAKCVLGAYDDKYSCKADVEKEDVTGISEEFVAERRQPPVDEPQETESVAIKEAPLPDTLEQTAREKTTPIDETPIHEAAAAEKPLTDEFIALTISQMKKSEIMKEEEKQQEEELVSVLEPEPKREELKDDIWGDWGAAPPSTKKKKKKGKRAKEPEVWHLSPPQPNSEPVPVEEIKNDPWGDWGGSASKTKKKPEKVCIPDDVPNPTHEELTVEPSSRLEPTAGVKQQEAWRDYLSAKSNIDEKDVKDTLLSSTSNIELEPEEKDGDEWASLGYKKKKGKKNKTSVAVPVPELEPIIDHFSPVQERGGIGKRDEEQDTKNAEYCGTSRENESLQKPVSADVIEETAPLTIEKPYEEEWGEAAPAISKKKKKSKKGLVSVKATVSVPYGENVEPLDTAPDALAVRATDTVPMEGKDVMQTETTGFHASNGQAYTEGSSKQHIEAQAGICPLWHEHLYRGDQWKTCQQCQAYLHQIAINQVRGGHADGVKNETLDPLSVK